MAKAHVKKIAYRRHVRAMLQSGKVNNAAGAWVEPGCCDSKVAQRASIVAQRMKP